MNGYEKLNSREADFLWDRERKMPEAEFDDSFFDRLNEAIELTTPDPDPCDLYDKCWECPNFFDCFGLPIPQEISSKVII